MTRKTQNAKRKTKNEKRKTKNAKRKTQNAKRERKHKRKNGSEDPPSLPPALRSASIGRPCIGPKVLYGGQRRLGFCGVGTAAAGRQGRGGGRRWQTDRGKKRPRPSSHPSPAAALGSNVVSTITNVLMDRLGMAKEQPEALKSWRMRLSAHTHATLALNGSLHAEPPVAGVH